MMNDYMIEGMYPNEDLDQVWLEVREGQLPPIAWDGLRSRLRQATRIEQLWEAGFVVAMVGLMGWYLFWLYEALQNFTIIPLP